jgi:hypothetical protein
MMSEFNGTVGEFESLDIDIRNGDVVANQFTDSHIIIGTHYLLQAFDNELNKKHIVKSFAPRKNTGTQPVGDDVWVELEIARIGLSFSGKASCLDWRDVKSHPYWKPLLNQCPNPAAKSVPIQYLNETPEEREAFERLTRDQQINAIAAVVRTCPTTSSTGIAVLLVDAGCSIRLTSAQK